MVPLSLRSFALSALALFACAAPQPAASQALTAQRGSYELEVLVDGVAARTYEHAGETHMLGQQGQRYVLRVHNRSARRVEAVVSVDGLDVIDGKPGDWAHKRGYLVPAYGSVDIDGWRLSDREAAAFRFAPIADSYAAKTGSARNVGVIGVAVFPERKTRLVPVRPVAPLPAAAPADEAASRGQPAPARSQREAEADRSAGGLGSGNAAPAPEARMESKAKRSRSGLGTEFGEAVSSEIHEVQFTRANPNEPSSLLGARYNDRAGLLALGIDVDGDQHDLALRQSASPFPVSRRPYARPPADWRHD